MSSATFMTRCPAETLVLWDLSKIPARLFCSDKGAAMQNMACRPIMSELDFAENDFGNGFDHKHDCPPETRQVSHRAALVHCTEDSLGNLVRLCPQSALLNAAVMGVSTKPGLIVRTLMPCGRRRCPRPLR